MSEDDAAIDLGGLPLTASLPALPSLDDERSDDAEDDADKFCVAVAWPEAGAENRAKRLATIGERARLVGESARGCDATPSFPASADASLSPEPDRPWLYW